MNLYAISVTYNGTDWTTVYYWADCAEDARNQAILDGALNASVWPDPAPAEYLSQFNGPDFTGRRAWLVFDSQESLIRYIDMTPADASGLLYGVAADDYGSARAFDPAPFAEHRVCFVEPGNEANALLEEGWDAE